jgi:hypothetical protein
MANSNGRIYIDTSTNPDTGISIADIQTVILSNKNDIGQLCRDANVSMWPKYKPVRYNKWGELTEQERKLANYGLDIPAAGYSSIEAMVAGLASSAWTYLQPRGLKNTTLNPTSNDEQFRFLDFNGYDHNATPPLAPLETPAYRTAPDSTCDLGLGFSRNIVSQTGYLTLDDLHVNGHSISDSFDEYYFGIAVYYNDNTRYATTMQEKYGTLSPTLSEIGLSVQDVMVPGSGTMVYQVIPFFATIPFETRPVSYVGSLFPLPFAVGEVRLTRDRNVVYCYSLMFAYENQTNKVYYQYNITNLTGSTVSPTVYCWLLNSYNINDNRGQALRTEQVTITSQDAYTSPQYEITDSLVVSDILDNVTYFGVEVKTGEVRTAYSIFEIIKNADPLDPPYIG